MFTLSAFGWVMITVAVFVQLLASFTVTVYVPGQRPVTVGVVAPPGAQL